MENQMLAITLADHSFYPITDETGEIQKNLVLTTAHDGQNRALIRFCRVTENTMDQEQVGVLDFRDLPPQTHGELEIDLELDFDETGNLAAVATERSTGRIEKILIPRWNGFLYSDNAEERVQLDHSHSSEADSDELNEPSWDIMESSLEEDPLIQDSFADDFVANPNKKVSTKNNKVWLLVLLFILVLVLGIWYFLSRPNIEPSPPIQTTGVQGSEQPQAPPTVQGESQSAAEPETQSTTTQTEAPAPTVPQPPQPSLGDSSINHRIMWGDTLWHLSQRFYGTPWRYPDIADYNLIPNPDLIIAGEEILIPVENPE